MSEQIDDSAGPLKSAEGLADTAERTNVRHPRLTSGHPD